ncbi:MAG: radical SAM protein [Anaerolineae bacterium]
MPAYRHLLASGEFESRLRAAYARLRSCDLCPRTCGKNRRTDARGACRIGERAVVAAAHPHFGEEAPLVGVGGSGTIFFAGCNLHCLYCQNHDISQSAEGDELEPEELAAVMLRLQDLGCHNINLISPSHVVPQILAAVLIAAQAGLRLPLVYNSGGYDALSTLALLDGVVDIYMPDAKYADPGVGRRLSGVPDYPALNRAAIGEMHRQVGDLQLNERGIAHRGLLVRHLVLPNDLAGSADTLPWLAREVSPNTYVNIMSQYRPCYRASTEPMLSRRATMEEYRAAEEAALAAGLCRLDR